MYSNLLVLFWTCVTIDCQRWYTATWLDNNDSEQSSNFKPNFGENEHKHPVTSTDHLRQKEKKWNSQKSEILFYPIDERLVEGNFVSTTTVPSTTNPMVLALPVRSETKDPYPRYEKIPTAEPEVAKNTSRKQSYIRHDSTITNVNFIKGMHMKKRRIGKRCPALRPHRKVRPNPNRKAKFLDVFQVVQFEHVPCVSSSGLEGICLHEYECTATGSGIAMGECADGYGVCCVTQFACGDQSAAHMGWFTNPGYPLPSTERVSCSVILTKESPYIKQIRLDFLNFELLQPTAGSCELDQFVVSGHNINNFIPILCGVNNGQHMYLEVGDVPGPIYLSVQTVTADTRLFAIKARKMDTAKIRVIFEYEFRRGTNAAETARNINAAFGEGSTNERTVRFWFKRFRDGNLDLKNEPRGRPPTQVTQLTNTDELAVPTGCLQYYKDPQGFLESFNYQGQSSIALPKAPSYLNNLNYAMCIERVPETCSITYTNSGEMEIVNFDIDGLPLIPKGQAGVEIFNCPTDWLLIAAARLCGDRLNDGTVLQDFSEDAPVTETAAGPITVWFRSDGVYSGRGFRLQYQQNPCTSPP